MTAREINGKVRIVVCQRGDIDDVGFRHDVGGVYGCFHCHKSVLVIGDDILLIADGAIDAICQECAIELSQSHNAFRPEHIVNRSQL